MEKLILRRTINDIKCLTFVDKKQKKKEKKKRGKRIKQRKKNIYWKIFATDLGWWWYSMFKY